MGNKKFDIESGMWGNFSKILLFSIMYLMVDTVMYSFFNQEIIGFLLILYVFILIIIWTFKDYLYYKNILSDTTLGIIFQSLSILILLIISTRGKIITLFII